MSSSGDPPARNTRAARAQRAEKRSNNQYALLDEEQIQSEPYGEMAQIESTSPADTSNLTPIAESPEANAHAEASAPGDRVQSTLLTEQRFPEEEDHIQCSKDAVSDTIREIPDERHFELEQSFTTAPASDPSSRGPVKVPSGTFVRRVLSFARSLSSQLSSLFFGF
jgi:hypothetical protein